MSSKESLKRHNTSSLSPPYKKAKVQSPINKWWETPPIDQIDFAEKSQSLDYPNIFDLFYSKNVQDKFNLNHPYSDYYNAEDVYRSLNTLNEDGLSKKPNEEFHSALSDKLGWEGQTLVVYISAHGGLCKMHEGGFKMVKIDILQQSDALKIIGTNNESTREINNLWVANFAMPGAVLTTSDVYGTHNAVNMDIERLKSDVETKKPTQRLYKLINNSKIQDNMLEFNISSAGDMKNIGKETGIMKMLTSGEDDFGQLLGYSGAMHRWKQRQGVTPSITFSTMIKYTINNLIKHDLGNRIKNILFINHTCQSMTTPRVIINEQNQDGMFLPPQYNPLLKGVVDTNPLGWNDTSIDVGEQVRASGMGGKRRKIKKRLCSKKKLRKKMICRKGTKKKHKKLHKLTKKLKIKLAKCSEKRLKKWKCGQRKKKTRKRRKLKKQSIRKRKR